MTRLLFLVNSLPAAGGAEQFVLNHARRADRGRYDVRVAQMGGSETLRGAFEAIGVPVVNLGERRRPDPRALVRLYAYLRRERIDVVQAHVAFSVLCARVVGRLARVPAIVATEQAMVGQYPRATQRALEATARLANACVFISRASFRSWQKVLPSVEPLIIPNGIDARAVAARAAAGRDAVRAELGLAPDDIAFANVARLHPDKGQATLLAAFARAALPRARLFIAGVGPLAAELRAQAAGLGVGERVRFLGERTDVPRLLGGFDAYVHPSRAEALGVSVLEAMSAALPTIGAAVDALPEYIADGATGWLFPPDDAAALAERLRAVAADLAGARAVGRAGQARMFRDYDIGASVAAYEALYERLLARVS